MSKKDKKEDGKKLREKFNLRAKPGQVIPYTSADKPLRKRMKKVMEPINKAPFEAETVAMYGWRPVTKLERSARRTGDLRQRSLAVQDNFFDTIEAIKRGPLDKNGTTSHETLGKIAKETLLTLEGLQDEARRIDRQRRDAAREIGIHVGAAVKLEQKFNGKFVRKPLAKFAKSGTPKAKEKLMTALQRGEDLRQTTSDLVNGRVAATTLKSYMRGLRTSIKDVHRLVEGLAEGFEKVENSLETSRQEWKKTLKASSAGRGKSGPKA